MSNILSPLAEMMAKNKPRVTILVPLIHWRLETPERVKCWPRSNAAERDVWSGLPLFANSSTISPYEYVRHIVPASVAQLDAPSDWRPGGRGFNPRRGRQHSFVEIDHEIFSTVILSLPLIQEGQLSVSGERMCTLLVNRLED